MKEAIQLFGFLVLAVLGFVSPIIALLLSIFREGMRKLAAQYESEKVQSENNIKAQLRKMGKRKTTDDSAIESSLKELRSIKKTAEAKLSYLDPKKQVIRLFIPLILALLGVALTLLLIETSMYYCFFLLLSLAALAYTVVVLWKLIGIITEVRKIIDTDRKDTDSTIIELLSVLGEKVEKTGQYFLKNIYVVWNGNDIRDDSQEATMRANNKEELNISIRNIEMRMAKNVEIGLIFPNDFIIEKRDYYSIYRDDTQQVIRFNLNDVQASTLHIFSPVVVTPLERNDYKIRTFIKAENVEATYRNLTLKVT
ncbi:hypothetical protein ES703_125703 [subsurface metagenome]